jgi:hypothetical protein
MQIRQQKHYRFELNHWDMLNLVEIVERYQRIDGRDRECSEFAEDFIRNLPKGEFPPEDKNNKSRWKNVFKWL